MSTIKIAFAGMSHLGLISAFGAAEMGFQVVCYDAREQVINDIKEAKLSIFEPGLLELLLKNKNRLHFTHVLKDIAAGDLVYISQDVPTNEDGESDISAISDLMNAVTANANEKALVVILSQVPPGFTRNIKFEKSRLFYQAETLIFGKAIERVLRPERIIIGVENESRKIPENLRNYLEAFNCPIVSMKYESAELSKIAINMFLASSVTTANTIADLSEKIGADWNEIAPVLRMDRRIGRYAYLTPGLGIAGGNLERDLASFQKMANQHGSDFSIVTAWRRNSRHCADWALKKLHFYLALRKKKMTLGILGLSYKEDTASMKNSPSVSLISTLNNFEIFVYDPAVKKLPEKIKFSKVENSIFQVYKNSDLLMIMTPWSDFKKINPMELAKNLKEKIVIDPYGILDSRECERAGLEYCRIGN